MPFLWSVYDAFIMPPLIVKECFLARFGKRNETEFFFHEMLNFLTSHLQLLCVSPLPEKIKWLCIFCGNTIIALFLMT
jgi:hypothetical protein